MIELRVITVPALEPENIGVLHTAYTVHDDSAGCLRTASGWTLRDAIDYYARDYKVQRTDIVITRPFVPQEIYLLRCGVFT